MILTLKRSFQAQKEVSGKFLNQSIVLHVNLKVNLINQYFYTLDLFEKMTNYCPEERITIE